MKKWKLLSTKDISPHKWLPLEMRTYELPDGRIVDDFSVVTLADVVMILPITKEGKVVLVKQFKPGIGDIFIQFPAGRLESEHADLLETAVHELEEETGIKVSKDSLHCFLKFNGFPTKATEVVYMYFVKDCEFNSKQNLDQNEDIEVLQLSPQKLDEMILSGEIWCAQTIAAWEMAKKKFEQDLLGYENN